MKVKKTYFRGYLQINWNILVISHHVSKLYYSFSSY